MSIGSSKWPSLVVFFMLVAAAALFGTQFKPGDWYAGLIKPAWTLPNWVFGPVWTVLYVMITLAGWLTWRTSDRSYALAAWGVALVLNASWSWLFFGRQAVGLALVDIVTLWWAISFFILAARTKNSVTSLLFVPYLLWVSYATALNFAIWRSNVGSRPLI